MNNSNNSGNKRDLIYIMSPSYSGSTLLTYLLATHPEISTIGELKATSMGDIDSYSCSCGSLLKECQFWSHLQESMQEQNAPLDFHQFGTNFKSESKLCNKLLHSSVRGRLFEFSRKSAFSLMSDCMKKRSDILDKIEKMIAAVCELQGGRVFLDGSKDPVRLQFLNQSGLWNVKVINLIRDGRGVTNSFMRHYEVGMNIAAKEWLHSINEIRKMETYLLPEQLMSVVYEDLCQEPDAVLTDIFEFIGIDKSLVNTDFRNTSHHILGNSMRLGSTSEIRLDEKWKQSLGMEALDVFASIAGDSNKQLGYE
ncbi:MAG TPA: hypothetical protein ENI64_08805 [Gammaproteobacteria bacterium]|nr:hypothetical protein [Gammaproteobacteria bacterium]